MNQSNITIETSEDFLEIGTIVSPHGLGGELKVVSSTDFPERFEKAGQRWLQFPNSVSPQKVELLKGRYVPGKNLYIIKLEGIEDKQKADTLRGCKLLVPKSDRPQLNEEEYHVSDLINLEVYHQETGELIGVVTDLLSAGNDLLEVQLHQQTIPEDEEKQSSPEKFVKNPKKAKVLIPFVYDIVPLVDLENKRIEINPPDGLLELS